MSIRCEQLTKRFGSFHALDHVDLDIPGGQLTALLGPSGSGKTTLLRVIAGLEKPDSGRVLFSGEDATRRSPGERAVGFVFQHYALFRHMTIFQNIAFGLEVKPRTKRPDRSAIRDKVMGLLKLIQLEWIAERYPHELSGGQRQRIALARALAVEPKVLLLDEPFGALDAKVRTELRRWLRRLHDEIGITSVFVTHDQEEAMEVADQVVVINQGKVEQAGSPDQIYNHPASPFVFEFIGHVNRWHGTVQGGEAHLGGLRVPAPELAHAQQAAAVGYSRPHELGLLRQPVEGAIAARIEHIHALGPITRYELRQETDHSVSEVHLPAAEAKALGLQESERVWVVPRRMRIYLKDGGCTEIAGSATYEI